MPQGFEDPTAIRIGNFVGVDDMPAEGWPTTFKEAPVRRILAALEDWPEKDAEVASCSLEESEKIQAIVDKVLPHDES